MENIQEILLQQNMSEENGSLICNVCKNYLSIPPILHNDTLGSICGRENCTKFANVKGTNYRQRAYEVLASVLNFPCMHRENGCQEKLGWEKIGEHEKICRYANFICPFSGDQFENLEDYKCAWEGNASALLEHLEKIHPTNRFDEYVEFDIANDVKQNQIFFSKMQESIVIMLLIVDPMSSFYLKVWCGPEVWRNLNYKIEILTERAEVNALKVRKAELIQPSFFKNKINSSWLKVNFAYIRDFFDSPNSLAIKFYIDGIIVGQSQKSYITPTTLLLKDAKCVQCLQELVHPVYVCKSKIGHNICDKCVVKPHNIHKTGVFGSTLPIQPTENSTCPLCNTGVSRNFAFEKIKLVVHQSFKHCKLCYKKVDGLLDHLTSNHKTSIFQLDKCYSDFSLNHYFFLFDNLIFLFSKSYTLDNKLSFGVQCLDTKEIKYKYELQLMNTKYAYSTITFGNFCHPEIVNLKFHEIGNHSSLTHETSIPHEVLRNIFPDINSIEFKLSISWI